MFSGFAAAVSGIQAGSRVLGVNAHNIANAQTDNFKRTRATLEESSAGGVVVSLNTASRPGVQLSAGEDPFNSRQESNVALEEELISILGASNLVEANVASAQFQDQALGSLLDILE